MGSFSSTCCISGLPIEAGDPVRFMLLTESPYRNEMPVSSTAFWIPRTFPVRGIYNDYGSVEDVPDNAERHIWLDALKLDLVETPWGDNTVHDVPVRKDMSWDDLLHALVERRVCVQAEYHEDLDAILSPLREAAEELKKVFPASKLQGILDKHRKEKRRVPPGVPTRKRVEKALQKAGFSLYGNDMKGGFIVNRAGHGTVRIRWQSWDQETYNKNEDFLAKAQAVLPEYATMLAAGRGWDPELFVRPKPKTKDFYGESKSRRKSSLQITQAMIREDVWEALLTITPAGPTNVRDAIRSPVPFMLGLETHWRLMEKRSGGRVPDEFHQTAKEFVRILQLLGVTRYYWRSGHNIGPQFGEWALHRALFKSLYRVAQKHLAVES